jgi:hypothetical protein
MLSPIMDPISAAFLEGKAVEHAKQEAKIMALQAERDQWRSRALNEESLRRRGRNACLVVIALLVIWILQAGVR